MRQLATTTALRCAFSLDETLLNLGKFVDHLLVPVETSRIDLSVVDERPHRATRFANMGTIVESTAGGCIGDVGEHLIQRIFGIPQANGTDTGRIDQHTTGGYTQHVAGDRCVPTFGVAGSHRLGLLRFGLEQGVDERALARTGFAEQRSGAMRLQEFPDPIEPNPRLDARDHDLDTGSDRLHNPEQLGTLLGIGEIGFGQYNDRRRPSVPREHEKTFEFAGAKRPIESVSEEHNIDVGRKRLLLLAFARITANEDGSSRQDRVDGPNLIELGDDDPVAGDRCGG